MTDSNSSEHIVVQRTYGAFKESLDSALSIAMRADQTIIYEHPTLGRLVLSVKREAEPTSQSWLGDSA